MSKIATHQLTLERRGPRWYGAIAGLDQELSGRSIDGVERRARETLSSLLGESPEHISLHIVFAQDDLAHFATKAATLRAEAELAIARLKHHERTSLAQLAKALDSSRHLSRRDIGAVCGVHHSTVGQLMSQS